MTRILKIVFLCFTLINAGVLLQAKAIDPQCGVADPDGSNVWYDCKLLAVEGKGWTNTASYYERLPANARSNVSTHVWDLGRSTAGICVRFTTDSASIQVRWTLLGNYLGLPRMPVTGVSGVDLYGRNEAGQWRFLGNGCPTGVLNSASFGLTAGNDNILYLPLYNGVKSIEIGIPKGKTISIPKPSHREHCKPIVFYGSSITQGGCASRPGMAAPAIVGRALDVPVINLGFSGEGKMQPGMTDLLTELDPSIYVLDCLPNMGGAGMVTERIGPSVKQFRKAHPTTPILFVEDASFRNITPTGKGRAMRLIYDQLTQEGMKDLYFLSNEGMLGNDYEGTVDGLHPNDLGMMRQATVFIKSLTPILQSLQQAQSNNTPASP